MQRGSRYGRLRHQLLLAKEPASDDALAEIVDDIFLPLVTLR